MLKVVNQQMLSIVGWIVAAFIILSINGEKLTLLQNSIHGSHSTKTISTALKATQLKEVLKKIKQKEINYYKGLDKIMLFGSKAAYSAREILPTGTKDVYKKRAKTGLPQLSGVMQVTDINGDVQSFAVIEGKKYSTDDQVDGFILSEISPKGILFKKNKKEWFAPMPSVPFSINYKDGAAVSTQLEINVETEKPGG